MRAALIYPHQLYPDHPAVKGADLCVLIEEPLLFSQYAFHAQKLVLHRASLEHYQRQLEQAGRRVRYIESRDLPETGRIGDWLAREGVTAAQCVDLCDDWLERRLRRGLERCGIPLRTLADPHFLTPWTWFDEFADQREKWFFTDFYIGQRKRLGVLLEANHRPVGGKWSFDPENRKKLPKGIQLPGVTWPAADAIVAEAQQYVRQRFPKAPGSVDDFRYPVTREQALAGLHDFLDHRFAQFGEYEDAIHPTEPFLFHSVLTPALNIGLLSPLEIVEAALARIDKVPLNSLEGFLRQVIGWREYIRGVYRQFGRRQRTSNFWQHTRSLPVAFYDGTTGIEPVDTVIRRVQKHAYCHHIERLMILGNFMQLCEIEPNAIYQWFMELFIDAYDWVMVPNVYGMSQHADGGLITTKPYISGSSYVLKMSSFGKGPWCPIWDGLYWRFVHKHRSFFESNPRMAVMVSQLDRMGQKLQQHLSVAEDFLSQLHTIGS